MIFSPPTTISMYAWYRIAAGVLMLIALAALAMAIGNWGWEHFTWGW